MTESKSVASLSATNEYKEHCHIKIVQRATRSSELRVSYTCLNISWIIYTRPQYGGAGPVDWRRCSGCPVMLSHCCTDLFRRLPHCIVCAWYPCLKFRFWGQWAIKKNGKIKLFITEVDRGALRGGKPPQQIKMPFTLRMITQVNSGRGMESMNKTCPHRISRQ
jgi:hypothetical protein